VLVRQQKRLLDLAVVSLAEPWQLSRVWRPFYLGKKCWSMQCGLPDEAGRLNRWKGLDDTGSDEGACDLEIEGEFPSYAERNDNGQY
jgi:hypothetical protein